MQVTLAGKGVDMYVYLLYRASPECNAEGRMQSRWSRVLLPVGCSGDRDWLCFLLCSGRVRQGGTWTLAPDSRVQSNIRVERLVLVIIVVFRGNGFWYMVDR